MYKHFYLIIKLIKLQFQLRRYNNISILYCLLHFMNENKIILFYDAHDNITLLPRMITTIKKGKK